MDLSVLKTGNNTCVFLPVLLSAVAGSALYVLP